ncbi:hypothetical protein N7492_006898 [Penicillium capsulatum]|uniref:Glycine zipper 2TM domain-containing protein n=1 Tax=Penicillium capsulatum TaxID=69766 RepID=A0A9W9LLL1_9EURO|nr:hypothetical protein N7492_006898 [Penicillium capsulatum]KAJ6116732.1 hypothetical protein N7512_006457 [Penicillium capsulatum]
MADPYNPYTSYSTPTPGGVSYYPPDEPSYPHPQPSYAFQQQYGSTEPPPDPSYTYPSQPSPYHLATEPYQGSAPDRSYTPVGQPDYLGPVAPAGVPSSPRGKIPENMGTRSGHPAAQPRYSPSPSPHPPPVFVSDADDDRSSRRDDKHSSDRADDPETERGVGSSLAGGAAGYFLGHKKEHGLLGALGGAILGSFLEDKMKGHGGPSHGHRHGHGHRPHHHHHHHHGHRHSRSRSHSRHRGDDDL